jgi:hypothetical protein
VNQSPRQQNADIRILIMPARAQVQIAVFGGEGILDVAKKCPCVDSRFWSDGTASTNTAADPHAT